MDAPHLHLVLHPLLPLRTPRRGHATLRYGFDLRLADGPGIGHDDPLLAAFGAAVLRVEGADEHDEGLQRPGFDPGREVVLRAEGIDDDGDPVVGVRDAETLEFAGTLPYRAAAVVAAAREHGLESAALVLREERTLLDDRRTGVDILVHAPSLVSVEPAPEQLVARAARPSRARLVLHADSGGGLRWWDPSGRAGPADLGDVPVSDDLADALEELRASHEALAGADDADVEVAWAREALRRRTHDVWVCARAELGSRYVVGLLAAGMRRPAWIPEAVEAVDDAEPAF